MTLQKKVTGHTKGWDPPVFESLSSTDEYEESSKRHLVQTLGINPSEFSSRVRQEDSNQLLQVTQEQK